MPLQQADIRFARSVNMADVPEGGGPPSAQLIPDGASNTIVPDVREEDRATGKVEIKQVHTVLRNTDTAALLGANVILADPPNDPNVDITLLSTKDPFATRAQIVERIESSMSASVEFAGYLLENHGATQRSLQLFQRPGAQPPGVGLVYVLVYKEGQPGELRQRVRVKKVDAEQRLVSAIVNGTLAGAIGLGLRLWLAGLAIWAIGHVFSVWAARRDPQFVDVARRHLKYPTWVRP